MTAQRYVDEAYLNELTYWLRMRGLDVDRIGDILAEVETHVAVTGEPARVAFGPPAEYAGKWERRSDRGRWPVMVGASLVGAGAGFALFDGMWGVIHGKPLLGLGPWWLVGLGLALAAAVPAIWVKDLIDPSTGRQPARFRRKGLAVIVTAATLWIFIAGFEALVLGALMLGRGDPVVGLGHGWLVALGLALVVAAAAIVPVLRITDPRSGRPFFRTRRRLVLTVSALAVAFAVVFLVVGLMLR